MREADRVGETGRAEQVKWPRRHIHKEMSGGTHKGREAVLQKLDTQKVASRKKRGCGKVGQGCQSEKVPKEGGRGGKGGGGGTVH